MPSKKQTQPVADGFPCRFCEKVFRSERTLFVHVCAGKQRELEKDEKGVRMGLQVYRKFYDANISHKKKKTWDDFIRSKFYNDFVKVGRYICDINAVNTPQFITFLVQSGIPVAKWTSPVVYETYIRELTKKETPEAAVERNLLLMQQWAVDSGNEWRDFFRKVSPTQATLWIKTGRISPWVLYLCGSSGELFGRFSDEQLQIVGKYIDPDFWKIKMERHAEDVKFFTELFATEGV